MNILFVWTGVTSYAADCWRKLQCAPGVTLKIVADVGVPAVAQGGYRTGEVLRDLDCACVTRFEEAANVKDFNPDVIFAVGWHGAVVRAAVTAPQYRNVPKVCCFDMPWRWKLRCLVAPVALGRFLRHYAAAFVPGASCARYARWLGFRDVREGLCAVDATRFDRETSGETPLSQYFLYLGRNSEEKRIGDIRAAHALYRARGGTVPLRLCGKGLEDGFAAPEAVPDLLCGAVAIVLASSFDPWPVVLLEAMRVGCPVIASDRCMNRPELGKNWRVFPCGNVKALAAAMADAESSVGTPRAAAMRDEDIALAAKYDSSNWVRQVMSFCTSFTSSTHSTFSTSSTFTP